MFCQRGFILSTGKIRHKLLVGGATDIACKACSFKMLVKPAGFVSLVFEEQPPVKSLQGMIDM
jgi:DNA-directed RNA polymerase subunit RPC12/RpoP